MAGGNRRQRVDSLCNWGIGGWGVGDIDDGPSGDDKGNTCIRSSREGTGGVGTSCLYTGRDPKARESGPPPFRIDRDNFLEQYPSL